MNPMLDIQIHAQPDETTCGPTCLHSVYHYYNDPLPLAQVIDECASLEDGGTLAVLLGCHALSRGYRATIVTFNLSIFDPTWFADADGNRTPAERSRHLVERLEAQSRVKSSEKLRVASQAYIDFLNLGGQLKMRDLSVPMLQHYLGLGVPLLTGLSSTYLYQSAREHANGDEDDIGGYPTGHFVILRGYDAARRIAQVADPYRANPLGEEHDYEVDLDRLVCSILLGVLTYDANLLIIESADVAEHHPMKNTDRKA